MQGRPQRVRAPVKKKINSFRAHFSKGGPAENIYITVVLM
jgi:hypothetical protein